jgi:hypothetical protein
LQARSLIQPTKITSFTIICQVKDWLSIDFVKTLFTDYGIGQRFINNQKTIRFDDFNNRQKLLRRVD